MLEIKLVMVFGFLIIVGLFIFGLIKLRPLTKEAFCVCKPGDEIGNVISCKWFKVILSEFQERRNEFWNSLGQFVIIIAIITLLVLLLILGKIKSEAALPLISGLGSYGIGKTVNSIRNSTSPENQHNDPKEIKGE
jgi:hypothetical protein